MNYIFKLNVVKQVKMHLVLKQHLRVRKITARHQVNKVIKYLIDKAHI